MWLVATELPSTNPKLYFLILLQRTDGQGGLEWGRKESDTTDRLNWTERSFLGLSLLLHTQFRNGYANLDKIKAESWVTFLILKSKIILYIAGLFINKRKDFKTMTTQSQVKGNPRRWTTYGIHSPGSYILISSIILVPKLTFSVSH